VYQALREWNDLVGSAVSANSAVTLAGGTLIDGVSTPVYWNGKNMREGGNWKIEDDALNQWTNRSSVWSEDSCTPTDPSATTTCSKDGSEGPYLQFPLSEHLFGAPFPASQQFNIDAQETN
jgi:hypothetical protein